MKHFHRNDKGFTLVELIIVIAIIAILSAVSVPQYVRYVERSRIAVDEAYIGEVASTLAMVAATDIKINTCPVTVTFDTAGKIQPCTATGPYRAETEVAVNAYLLDFYPDSAQIFESNYYKGVGTDISSGVKLVLDAEGVVTISGTKSFNS